MNQQWTYKVVDVKAKAFRTLLAENVQDILTQHGMLGWELVQVVQSPLALNQASLYFKKPK
jgi:quinol monooxygenase YgiN